MGNTLRHLGQDFSDGGDDVGGGGDGGGGGGDGGGGDGGGGQRVVINKWGTLSEPHRELVPLSMPAQYSTGDKSEHNS